MGMETLAGQRHGFGVLCVITGLGVGGPGLKSWVTPRFVGVSFK